MNINLMPKSIVCHIGTFLDNKSISILLRSCKKLNSLRSDEMMQKVFCQNVGFNKDDNENWNDIYKWLKKGVTTQLVMDSLRFDEISFLPVDDSHSNFDIETLEQLGNFHVNKKEGIYQNEHFIYHWVSNGLFRKENKKTKTMKTFSMEMISSKERIQKDMSHVTNICFIDKERYALSLNYSMIDLNFYIYLFDMKEDKLVKVFTINKSKSSPFRLSILSNLKEIFFAYDEKIYLKAIFSKNSNCELFKK